MWRCTTESISGIECYDGAHGSIHRMTPAGHKYSKFLLQLYIPSTCGTLKDIIQYCKTERLKWDTSMSRADLLRTDHDESGSLLKTMLYTTKKEFGISARAFVEREWNIAFDDGSMTSFSNSLPFDEEVPLNAIEQLPTPHTRGVNYPGSAWIFEKEKEFTKMTMCIHSDLKGWIYPGLVNMSLNAHLGNFSRILLQYIEERRKKRN